MTRIAVYVAGQKVCIVSQKVCKDGEKDCVGLREVLQAAENAQDVQPLLACRLFEVLMCLQRIRSRGRFMPVFKHNQKNSSGVFERGLKPANWRLAIFSEV